MKALTRLSFSVKFAMLGLLVLIMIAVPTTMYVLTALESGRQTVQEARGITPVQELLQLINLTQQHRDLSVAVLGGDRSLNNARQAKKIELERAFEQVGRTLQVAQPAPAILDAWQRVEHQWRDLDDQVERAQINATQSMVRHSDLISACLLIEDALLDHFELALDPVLATYSLVTGALIEMPQTSELLGQLRGAGALYLAQGRILPEQQGALRGLTVQAMSSYDKMARVLAKASASEPNLKSLLDAPLAILRPQIEKALSLTNAQLVAAIEMDLDVSKSDNPVGSSDSGDALYALKLHYPLADYMEAYAQPIEALHALNNVAFKALDQALQARRNSALHSIILMSSGLLTLLLAGGALTTLIILRLLKQLAGAMAAAERIAKGDLTQELDTGGMDEAARLLQALQQMQSDLRGTVSQAVSATERLNSTSEELSAVTEDASLGLQRQSSEIDQAVTAVTELTSAIEDVARNAATASEVSQAADQRARQGQDSVTRTVGAVESLAGDMAHTADTLQALADQIGDIGSVLDVIRDIAEQTNLLALNAAIEAARAGESGRGFAVVADEVRALAQRTQESTKKIEKIIGSVQQGSHGALRAMQGSNEKTRDTLELARAAGTALNAIVDAIAQINERNLSIASVTEQQSQVAREVDSNLLSIRDVSAQTSAGANQIRMSSRELADLAGDLKAMINHFSV